jgi:ElaA protein
MNLHWHDKRFDQLTARELYGLIQLRERVFVVEQDCVYLDCDGLDLEARHLYATRAEGDPLDEVVACARVLAPGIAGQEPAIGRVVTAPELRGLQLGRELMERAISCCLAAHGETAIRVSAQSHLEAFYRSLGFLPTGKAYLEDGIPHLEMIRPAS